MRAAARDPLRTRPRGEYGRGRPIAAFAHARSVTAAETIGKGPRAFAGRRQPGWKGRQRAMPSDYAQIRSKKLESEDYVTLAERVGGKLLADLYGDRTHFAFELLQNAEDALRPVSGSGNPRLAQFALSGDEVRFSHFGKPFDENDVRAVCDILVSMKDESAGIGHFGIGFKSVGAITERPQIYSGTEHFEIKRYVLPYDITPIELDHGETVIVLPITAESDRTKIAQAFEKDLGARTLLFLREINQIRWSIDDGRSGHYTRSDRDAAADADGVRRIVLRSEIGGKDQPEEEWRLFTRDVPIEGKPPRRIEIAFKMDESGRKSIEVVPRSRLFAFFPTALETHLGFLVQGPYRTTPSRDNIKLDGLDGDWNRYLIGETADLLVEALRYLRGHDLLTPRVFDALPLDRERFEGRFFAPLFDAVHKAVASEPLLPAHRLGGGRSHIPASQAWLTKDAGLRNLISRRQLGELADADGPAGWLADGITADLHSYLRDEHGVQEIDLDDLLLRLESNETFLAAQTDSWIQRLYGFLHKQDLRRGALAGVPLIRLEDGSHIASAAHGRTDAYLPTEPPSKFPNTVRREVCSSGPALEFLKQLGLSEPDRVDYLIRNVIPRYREQPEVKPREYADDLRQMVAIHKDASPEQRRKLTEALRECAFVRAADAATGELSFVRPGEAYLGTERLRELFEGVPSVLLTAAPPRGVSRRDMTALLTACGAPRTLAPVTTREEVDRWRRTSRFSHEELRDMRSEEQGTDNITRNRDEFLTDSMFRWLKELIDHMQGLAPEAASRKARLLWEALCAVQDAKAFEGSYHWYYYNPKNHAFPSASVRLLNEAPWVPDESGVLQPPGRVPFDSLSWTPNPLVQSKIEFLPPARDALVKEAGVSKEGLEFLDKLEAKGIPIEEASAQLGLAEPSAPQATPASEDNGDGPSLADALREAGQPPRAAEEAITAVGGAGGVRPGGGATGSREAARQVVRGAGGNAAPRGGSDAGGGSGASGGRSTGGRSSGSGGGGARTFVSHIAVGAESEGEPDPDAHERRMGLEEAAIARIVKDEPALRRTPPGNAGFDLYEADDAGEIVRWVEVKSVSGGWESGPVSMSHTQFGMAREKGDAYWLYVVEHAGTDRANIVKIRDPAGRASTYTFNEGWRAAPPP